MSAGSVPTVRILLPEDKHEILRSARVHAATAIEDLVELEMHSWVAPWRGEALDHYLATGWSFGAFTDDGHLAAFALAQPIMFFRSHAQTVWIEYLQHVDDASGTAILDTVFGWAKDKHFQCVLVDDRPETRALFRCRSGARALQSAMFELRSARF